MKKKILILLSVFVLCVGVLIYIFFRSKSLLYIKYIKFIDFNNLPRLNFNKQSKLQCFIVYSAPNILWLLSFFLFMMSIWGNKQKNFTFYFLLISLISIGSELLQANGLIPGTFDLVDLSSSLICCCLVFVIYLVLLKKEFFYETRKNG
jgi:hypothetical protein